MSYFTTSAEGQVVQQVLHNLPGLVALAVVDTTSGMSPASHPNSAALNPDTAAAYNAQVVKQKQKALAALQLQGEKIQDIPITLSNQLHLINLHTDGNKFIYLVVNSHDTNLATAQKVLRQYANQLN